MDPFNREWPYQRVFCGVCGAALNPGEEEVCKGFHRENSPELRKAIRDAKAEIRAYQARQHSSKGGGNG